MIYFIQSGKDGPIKIGYTKDENSLHSRVGSVQCKTLGSLVILGAFDGDKKREKEIHVKFSMYRIGGEWFEPNKNIIHFINQNCNPKNYNYKTTNYVLKGIDYKLWKEIKKKAVDKNTTIQSYIISLLKKDIEPCDTK